MVDNTLVHGIRFVDAKHITMNVKQMKYIFYIFYQFWSWCKNILTRWSCLFHKELANKIFLIEHIYLLKNSIFFNETTIILWEMSSSKYSLTSLCSIFSAVRSHCFWKWSITFWIIVLFLKKLNNLNSIYGMKVTNNIWYKICFKCVLYL